MMISVAPGRRRSRRSAGHQQSMGRTGSCSGALVAAIRNHRCLADGTLGAGDLPRLAVVPVMAVSRTDSGGELVTTTNAGAAAERRGTTGQALPEAALAVRRAAGHRSSRCLPKYGRAYSSGSTSSAPTKPRTSITRLVGSASRSASVMTTMRPSGASQPRAVSRAASCWPSSSHTRLFRTRPPSLVWTRCRPGPCSSVAAYRAAGSATMPGEGALRDRSHGSTLGVLVKERPSCRVDLLTRRSSRGMGHRATVSCNGPGRASKPVG